VTVMINLFKDVMEWCKKLMKQLQHNILCRCCYLLHILA